MLFALFAIVVLVAVIAALVHLGRDETAVRRLRKSEYEPLVKHIWWQ